MSYETVEAGLCILDNEKCLLWPLQLWWPPDIIADEEIMKLDLRIFARLPNLKNTLHKAWYTRNEPAKWYERVR
jgi:hypothetical protein